MLGFVLLTHEKPDQTLRLLDRLNFMFDDPPIVCHHDFSKCDLPLESVPGNVSFVEPHLETAWGDWSLTEATVRGIKQLFSRSDKPEWFTLLSGTDYPITPAQKITDDLKSSKFDAHMSFLELAPSKMDSEMARSAFERYQKLRFKYPSFVHLLQSIRNLTWWRRDIYLKKSIYTQWFIPFSDNFHCYYGSQWFYGNRKAAECILEFHQSHPFIKWYYKNVHASDESYFHTILGNSDHLNIGTKYWRYIEWQPHISHPKQLSEEDFETLTKSNAHFARKFNMAENPKVLDLLDEVIGYK